jgi:thiamine pyrophosphokinase
MSEQLSATVVVVIGGGPITVPARLHGVDVAAIIAADGGYDTAIAAGLEPTQLVGDLDSISADGLATAEASRVPVHRHPADKDATDTELALDLAVELTVGQPHRELVVLGPDRSDRLDHLIGALTALGHPSLAGFGSVTAFLGTAEIAIVHPTHTVTLDLPAGRVVSVLALHGPCTGVEMTGSRWALRDAVVEPASSLGVSNESLGAPIRITTASGVLTVIIPHHESEVER